MCDCTHWVSKIVVAWVVACFPFFSTAASLVYLPKHFDARTAKVVVVVHGCLQSAESMAHGSGWNQISEKENLLIIYPQVPAGQHPIDCWRWFEPGNQVPDSGLLAMLRDEIKGWKARLGLKGAPVFVTGISSGGAMAAGLLACFPNEFIGGAIHSAPSYCVASSEDEAKIALVLGPHVVPPKTCPCDPKSFRKPVMILHGSNDPLVNPLHVERLKSDFFGDAPLFRSAHQAVDEVKYVIQDYHDKGQLRGRTMIVQGMGHVWSGFEKNLRHTKYVGPKTKNPTNVPFFTPQGPSSTDAIYQFMKEISQ